MTPEARLQEYYRHNGRSTMLAAVLKHLRRNGRMTHAITSQAVEEHFWKCGECQAFTMQIVLPEPPLLRVSPVLRAIDRLYIEDPLA